MRIVLISIVVAFLAFCGWLAGQSGLILLQQTAANEESASTNAPTLSYKRLESADIGGFSATGGPAEKVILGAKDPKTEDPDVGYKFQLELSSKGAAIARVTFSNGNDNGFDDRDYKDPQPLEILSPVRGDILSMANREFILVEQKLQFRLDQLSWKSLGVEKGHNGSQAARFEALIKTSAGNPVVELIKTYRVYVGSYQLDCEESVGR
jgi:hypothetical protein